MNFYSINPLNAKHYGKARGTRKKKAQTLQLQGTEKLHIVRFPYFYWIFSSKQLEDL